MIEIENINKSLSPLIHNYLQRQIELDDTHHFPDALRILKNIAGQDGEKWQDIEITARAALQARLDFLTCIQANLQ